MEAAVSTSTQNPKAKTASRNKKKKHPPRFGLGCLFAILAVVIFGVATAIFVTSGYRGTSAWVYMPSGSTTAAIKDSLKRNLGSPMGTKVYLIWRLAQGSAKLAEGAYLIEQGETAVGIARRLKRGAQTPVKATFRATRSLDDAAKRITATLQCTPAQFLKACSEVLPDSGFSEQEWIGAMLPDSYQFYWSTSAENLVRRLLDYRNRFWNASRIEKAKMLGLTPMQVTTLASIVEEETAKRDEQPLVARLYLNRLKKGMKLQADPTVKFAVGDWSLRRILNKHLETESPYNTYLHAGLPPAPIRMPDAKTIDAVLNAPVHDYIYMCAREDFSGYHNFAKDYATHLANARKYQAELNRRNIK